MSLKLHHKENAIVTQSAYIVTLHLSLGQTFPTNLTALPSHLCAARAAEVSGARHLCNAVSGVSP